MAKAQAEFDKDQLSENLFKDTLNDTFVGDLEDDVATKAKQIYETMEKIQLEVCKDHIRNYFKDKLDDQFKVSMLQRFKDILMIEDTHKKTEDGELEPNPIYNIDDWMQ